VSGPHLCPSCRRPAAATRPTCLYCGAPIPQVSPIEGTRTPRAPETPRRALVILDLPGQDATALVEAAGIAPYEAGLIARRGGPHLLRLLDEAAAEREAARLRGAGLAVTLVPEAEARIDPLRATGGERRPGRLSLRTEEGPLDLPGEDALLIVRGRIAREHRPALHRRRKVETATLEEGYRVHVHRRSEERPVEIDAANFEFGFAVTGSTRLEVDAWLEALAPDAPRDDLFRHLSPAFAPAEAEPRGPLAAAAALGVRVRDDAEGETGIFDNLRQFRFYSGWRGAIERRRAAAPADRG
jgi:hypothetical protein